MPEVRTDVTLENTIDRGVVRRGHGSEADIRRTTVSGLVNTGAAPVMLPPDVVEDLGLDLVGTARITYGDERPDEVGVAGPVTIAIGDRNVMTECLVGRPGSRSSSATSCSHTSTSSPTAGTAR